MMSLRAFYSLPSKAKEGTSVNVFIPIWLSFSVLLLHVYFYLIASFQKHDIAIIGLIPDVNAHSVRCEVMESHFYLSHFARGVAYTHCFYSHSM